MQAFSKVDVSHLTNSDWCMTMEILNLQSLYEQVAVYDELAVLQSQSCDMYLWGRLYTLDADETNFSYRMALLSSRFYLPILLLASALWRRLIYPEKKPGYRRYGRHIWSRRNVFWRSKNISRATYILLARQSRPRRSTETVGSFRHHRNSRRCFSTAQLVYENNHNVARALPEADLTITPLGKSKRVTIQCRVVNRERKDRECKGNLLPFIVNRKRTKR